LGDKRSGAEREHGNRKRGTDHHSSSLEVLPRSKDFRASRHGISAERFGSESRVCGLV
jgi:hypothetical protein